MIIKNYHTGPLAVNCYVVTTKKTKKTFMVDPGGHNSDMVNYIKENGLALEYIILTHAHGDHMGGVPGIQEEFKGVKLIACIHDKALLEDAKLNMSTMVLRLSRCIFSGSLCSGRRDDDGRRAGDSNSFTPRAIPREECAF